jgi:hypothetical protein
MDCRWWLTAHCAEVHGKLAMNCACTQVPIVQAMVNLYFCWCIILPHNKIRTLFVPALGYMYLCWALLIHAICVVLQGCVFCQIQSPYSYTFWARAVPTRIPLQCCKMYGGMLKIGRQPSRSTESWLKILGYITGSWVSHRASLHLLLWSWCGGWHGTIYVVFGRVTRWCIQLFSFTQIKSEMSLDYRYLI